MATKTMREWKTLEKWKRMIIIILALVVLLRLCYIWLGAEINREYVLSSGVDLANASAIPCDDITLTFSSAHDRLHSLELLFTGITPGQAGHIVLQIFGEENELIYQTNLSLTNLADSEWKRVYIGMELKEGKEYQIHLDASEDCAQIPNIYFVRAEQSAPEVIASAQGRQQLDGVAAIRFGYLQAPGFLDRFVISAFWLLAFHAAVLFIYHLDKTAAWCKKALNQLYRIVDRRVVSLLMELAACYIIVNSSGVPFQKPTILILYLISLCAAVKGEEKQRFLHELCDKTWKRSVLVFLYLYTAFALVGQRSLIYPFNKEITTVNLFVFAAAAFWAMPVVRTLLYTFHWITEHSFSTKSEKRSTLAFAAVCGLLLLFSAAFCLYVFNPGTSSYDTNKCMITLAKNLHGATDWHPFSYVLVLRVLQEIWDSTYMVIFVQWFFWIYVMLELLLYLRKKNIRDEVLYAAAAFSGFNVANALLLNTIWKDIPYALSLLWSMICIAKLSIDSIEYRKKWWIYVELTTAITGLMMYRNNGIVPFVLIVVSLIVVFWKNPRVWGAVAVAVALVCLVKGPVYNYFEVVTNENDPEHVGGKYIGLGQDILGVYYNGGEVSEHTLQMLTVLTKYNIAEHVYSPSYASLSYTLDVPTIDFIAGYVDTFVHNPIMMTRAIINREDPAWGIFAGENFPVGVLSPYTTCDGFEQWNNYYPARRYTSLYARTEAALLYIVSSQWISSIVWRCGLFSLLGIIGFSFIQFKRGLGAYAIILSPLVGQILSLIASTGWSDFRYFWPLHLMSMTLCLLLPVIAKSHMADAHGNEDDSVVDVSTEALSDKR